MKGLQKIGDDVYRAPDWETFVDVCEADCELLFIYKGAECFSYEAVTRDCETLRGSSPMSLCSKTEAHFVTTTRNSTSIPTDVACAV
jgi:hypothetical protein